MILWIPLEFDNWLLRYLKTHEDFDIGFSQEFVSGMRGDFLEASTRRSQAPANPLDFLAISGAGLGCIRGFLGAMDAVSCWGSTRGPEVGVLLERVKDMS